MKDTTLVIMAAGIGSRFGGGIKQLEPMGPNGEIIMDYSIYDAIEVGFNKVVFVIRKDLEESFKDIIGNRIEQVVKVEYVFQQVENTPEGVEVIAGREKPWGTGQAVLSCKGVVNEPFLVINADDYYGKTGFKKIHDYLVEEHHLNVEYDMCMAGFILGNTLSDNGSVTRGVCLVDESKHLVGVRETSGIIKKENGGAAYESEGKLVSIDPNSYVSMNMWGFDPKFFDELESGFVKFLGELKEDDFKSEYLLPTIVDRLIKSKRAVTTILETQDKWFGVTYKEDKPIVVESIKKLISEGKYPGELYK